MNSVIDGVVDGPPRPVPGPAARDAVLDELRHAEYHRDDRSWLARAGDWLLDQLGHLIPHGNLDAAGWLNSVVLWLIVAALVTALVVAVRRVGLPRRVHGRERAATDPLAVEPATDHHALATRYEADGRHAEALREWLRAAVATIETRGVLTRRPGRTGASVAREAGPRLPSAATALTRAAAAFDEVWFGGRPATADDVRRAHEAADAVDAAREASQPVGQSVTLS